MQLTADSRTWALPAGLLAIAVAVGALSGVDPRLGLAAAMSLGFVIVVMADLAVGLCLYALIAFLNIVPDLGGSFLSFDKVAGALLAVSWLAAVASRKGARRAFVAAHPLFAAVLVFFLAWTALSLTWVGSFGDGIQSVTRYFLSAFLFLIVFTAIRTRRHVEWLLGAFVLASLLSALYGFVTPPDPQAVQGSDRLAGTLGDANALAAVLVAGVAIAFALAYEMKRKPLVRILLVIAGALCLLCNLLTLSRGGLVALGVALVAAVIFGGRWRIYALVMGILVTLAVVCFFAFVATPEQTARVTNVNQGGGSGRTDLWTVGWRMVEAHPVRGVGAGNFQPESIHYLIAPGALHRSDLIINTQHVAHNTYLQVLSEMGIVALRAVPDDPRLLTLVDARGRARVRRTRGTGDGDDRPRHAGRAVRHPRGRLLRLGPVQQAAVAPARARTGAARDVAAAVDRSCRRDLRPRSGGAARAVAS